MMQRTTQLRRLLFISLVHFVVFFVLAQLALHLDIPGFNLALPLFFFLLFALQQDIRSLQAALYIAILLIFIPVLSQLDAMETTVVYSFFFLLTLLSFEGAKILKKKPPFPDVVAPIFIFLALLSEIPMIYTYGIVVAYYLARLTTFFLKMSQKLADQDRGKK